MGSREYIYVKTPRNDDDDDGLRIIVYVSTNSSSFAIRKERFPRADRLCIPENPRHFRFSLFAVRVVWLMRWLVWESG